jgi:hypothetical protein
MTDKVTPALAAAGPTRERLWAAVDDLERAVTAPAPGRVDAWRARSAATLETLLAEWGDHIRLAEAEGGLFDEIMDQEPRLAHAIERLRHEHVELADKLGSAATALERVADESGVAASRAALVGLIGGLSLHRHRGVDLVYEAYNTDISADD